ncbi:MAG: nucleotidyltransferase family protein [Candidatus Kryptoniota bacterium]
MEDLISLYEPIFLRHHIKKAILFGSFARNEASKHSDLDLILIQETDKPFFERYETILQELNQITPHRSVDLLIYTPEELAAIRHRTFIAKAMKDGIVIYESK